MARNLTDQHPERQLGTRGSVTIEILAPELSLSTMAMTIFSRNLLLLSSPIRPQAKCRALWSLDLVVGTGLPDGSKVTCGYSSPVSIQGPDHYSHSAGQPRAVGR